MNRSAGLWCGLVSCVVTLGGCGSCEQVQMEPLYADDGGSEARDGSVSVVTPAPLGTTPDITLLRDAGTPPTTQFPVVTPLPLGCAAGLTMCGSACVDLKRDPLHCGACATACDDGNVCSEDACSDGACVHRATREGSACLDPSACSVGSVCRSGQCTGDHPLDCDDGDACTTDACDDHGCTHDVVPDGASCADGNACNGSEVCVAGVCSAGDPVRCDDGNPCTAERCESGACVSEALPDGTGCGARRTCLAGVCTGQPAEITDAGVIDLDAGTDIPGGLDAGDDVDAAVPDAAIPVATDAGEVTIIDAGEAPDAAILDAGEVPDAAILDAGDVADAAISDAGEASDAAIVDASMPEPSDAGEPDAAVEDAGEPVCDDGNPCTFDGVQDGGACMSMTLPDGTPCGMAQHCIAGVCTAIPPSPVDAGVPDSAQPICDDGNPCTDDFTDGGCLSAPVPDGTACGPAHVCIAGQCVVPDAGSPDASVADASVPDASVPDAGVPDAAVPSCDDGNPCTVDALSGGSCTHTPAADGTACGDDDDCNGVDTCSAGTCTAAPVPTCDDDNPCTQDRCANKHCENVNASDGADCSDGNACNGSETCLAGLCMPGANPLCDDGNPCTIESCDAEAGCVSAAAPDATACLDGDACNGPEQCISGVCQPGIALACDDGNPCTADSCDPAQGCVHTPVADGASCADLDACNGAETCQAGTCAPAAAPTCDDGNPCTVDTCDAERGCTTSYAPDGTACADADACNGDEVCTAGTCTAVEPPSCDDDNPCTVDSCDVVTGCDHAPVANGISCGDADVCTGAQVCEDGACTTAPPLTCDDGNPCTRDRCDPVGGCTTTALPDDTPCGDGISCNGNEFCHQGSCQRGNAPSCGDDGNPCTMDVCGDSGCEHRPVFDGYPCSDERVCNGSELCMGGTCIRGTEPTCDDNNPCTVESCSDSANSCIYTPVADGLPCDDGIPETDNDICHGGVCGAGTGTHRVSEGTNGRSPFGHSEKPFLSEDNRFIAFQSHASDVVPGDTNGVLDVFVVAVNGGAPVRVSTDAAGNQGNNISRLSTPNVGLPGNAITGDGSLITFISLASNLVPGDTNNDWDVFVKERVSGNIRRASVSSTGAQAETPADAASWPAFNLTGEPAISQDGHYVVFSGYAKNLVDNDRNGAVDVFRHDLQTGRTELVSISSTGVQGNADSDMPSVSGDGRCVAFRSLAGNLHSDPANPDTNGQYDIYVRDMAAGSTWRITHAFDGGQTNNVSYYPRISADCQWVSFVSWSDNLVPGDTNGTLDVFVTPVAGGPVTRVSTSSEGMQGNLRTGGPPTINRNGRYVGFYSWATNLTPEDHNINCNYVAIVPSRNCVDVFVKDVWTGATRRISINEGGQEANNNSQDPSLSGDGTGIAFGSYGRNMDPDKNEAWQDIFYTRTGLESSR